MHRRALTILTVSIAAVLIGVLGLVGIVVAAQQTASAERIIDDMTVTSGGTVTVSHQRPPTMVVGRKQSR